MCRSQCRSYWSFHCLRPAILKQKTGSGDRPPPPLLLLPCATYHHDRLIESCLGLVSKSAGTAWLKFLLHSRTFAETETGPDACSTGARLECFSSWFMRYQRLACKGLGRFVVVLTLCPSASDRLTSWSGRCGCSSCFGASAGKADCHKVDCITMEASEPLRGTGVHAKQRR